jgi:hypothetical protein
MKKVLKTAAILMIGGVLGVALGAWVTSRNYERYVLDPIRYEKAGVAGYHVNILSLLRIDAEDEAIEHLETMLDNETLVLTQNTNDPGQLPGDVIRTLKQIRAYRQIFPAEGARATDVENALARIPDLNDYKKDCRGGVCRLLESRTSGSRQMEMDAAHPPQGEAQGSGQLSR